MTISTIHHCWNEFGNKYVNQYTDHYILVVGDQYEDWALRTPFGHFWNFIDIFDLSQMIQDGKSSDFIVLGGLSPASLASWLWLTVISFTRFLYLIMEGIRTPSRCHSNLSIGNCYLSCGAIAQG